MKKREIKSIMEKSISPQQLAEEKYKAYSKYVVGILEDITIRIQQKDWEGVFSRLFTSSAGDGYGDSNQVINFSYHDYPMDIYDAMVMLNHLNLIATGQKNPDTPPEYNFIV